MNDAITCLLLQLLEPANLAVSVESLKRVESQVRHVEEQLELQLKEARYRADLARRRYDIVDPENRLIAADLERRWNECLEEVRRLERRLANKDHQTLTGLSETEEAAVLALAGDLPRVWRSETTTTVERKQLLRCLIKDVALTKSGQEVRARVRLQTGACVELWFSVVRQELSERRAAARERKWRKVEWIRELSPTHTDAQIAERLSAEGFKPFRAKSFTAAVVKNLRYSHKIDSAMPEICRVATPASGAPRGDGRYSSQAVAEMLTVNIGTVDKWCRSGRLDAIRSSKASPWWTSQQIESLRKPARRKALRGNHSPPVEVSVHKEVPKQMISEM